MDFDAHIERQATGPIVVGEPLSIVLDRDRRPLPGQPLELGSDTAPLGLWRRSDEEGRARWRPPLAGRWLLRAVDLRPAAGDPDRWASRFVTLVFDVARR